MFTICWREVVRMTQQGWRRMGATTLVASTEQQSCKAKTGGVEMNGRNKLFSAAFLVSLIIGLALFSILVLLQSAFAPFSVNAASILTVNLQVTAVLYGFSATLIVYTLRRSDEATSKSAIMFAHSTSISYIISIASGLLCLFNAENMPPLTALFPISFTLTGMIATMAFLHSAIFKIAEKKETV